MTFAGRENFGNIVAKMAVSLALSRAAANVFIQRIKWVD
jgi:hypothetical protein